MPAKAVVNAASVANVANANLHFPIGNIGYWLLASFTQLHIFMFYLDIVNVWLGAGGT